MNTTSRAFKFAEVGGPDQLRLEPEQTPEPGHGEVRVRVEALGLNRADLLYLAGAYIESPQLPARLGYEVCGTIEAVGPGVTTLAVGDRVSSVPAFSLLDHAAFGETATLPERGLMRTPDRLSPTEGASFAFAYLTGYFALFELARLQPYQTVLVTAATSTTGQAAIPLIHRAGAQVIQKLNDAGIYHWWQLAAMTEADAQKLDQDLKLSGRIEREGWATQAREQLAAA